MSDLKILKTESGQQVVDYEYAKNLIEQLQQRVQELEIAIGHSLRDMEYAAFNLCESMNLDSKNGGRTVETTCPEKTLLIAIRDLKEATGARP